MGSGDSKAELATVGQLTSIVSLHRSWGGGLSEKIPCMERHSSLSNANNVEQPGSEHTPTLWLITGDKDKGEMKGGVAKTLMARMAKTVVVTAKRGGMVAMVGWGVEVGW